MSRFLIPHRRQWARWSLPSKLTAVGALLGIVSLLCYGVSELSSYLGRQAQTARAREEARLLDADVQIRANMVMYSEKAGQFAQTLEEIVRLLEETTDPQGIVIKNAKWFDYYFSNWVAFSQAVTLHYRGLARPTSDDLLLEQQETDRFMRTLNNAGNRLRVIGVDVDGKLKSAQERTIKPGSPFGFPLPDHELKGPLQEALRDGR